QIFMDADQAEGPGPRRSKIRQAGQGQTKELSGHHLKAANRRPSYADPQGPERPSLAIVGSLLVQPAAIETHVVVKAPGLQIESVMQKCSAGAGQRPG